MLTDEQIREIMRDGYAPYITQAYRLGVAAERKRCANIAWQYARGLRKPSGTSYQQGDDIANDIERGEDA